ncbi:MAG: phosphatidate cytidylyltransferase [Chloroflexi bacterium]|nr:phosphatidate cytidylyltransferase [Chloroflexota bacterium]
MLPQRVASTLVGVPIILGLIHIGGVGYAVAAAFILAAAALEFYAAVAPSPPDPAVAEATPAAAVAHLLRQRPLGYIGAGAVALLVAGAQNGLDWWTGALVLAVVITFLWLIVEGQVETALHDWLWALGGILYVGFLGSHLILLRHLDNGRDWLMVAVFGTFIVDTSAYFVGRAIGRQKLAPRISPGKTVEGALGGMLAGSLGVVTLNWVTGLRIDVWPVAGLAILLPIAALAGDLGESLVKRGAAVKDASAVVPGHGGFLDRLDSVLFTVPLVYYYAIWVAL